MKKMHVFLIFISWLIGLAIGMHVSGERAKVSESTVTKSVETSVDTMTHIAPMPMQELSLGTRRYTLPARRADGGGSGGEPRQRKDKDSILIEPAYIDTTQTCGSGAGGEPRCSSDSTSVELPVIQRHYADSTYEAWVSGPVDSRLDSIHVFRPTTTITARLRSPTKKWHIGPTIGYGYTPHGFEPYIGVSLTYSLFSF